MIANPMANRRANAFADALEDEGRQGAAGEQHGQTGHHRAHAADRRNDPDQGLLAVANALRDVPRPKLDENRKVEQRAQLIAAMESALADGTLRVPGQRGSEASEAFGAAASGAGRGSGPGAHRAPRRRSAPRSRWSRKLAASGLSVGVAAGAFGGVAAASTNALPGDTLYGLKRGMEDMRLSMADGESDRGEVYLDLASVRFQEARRLMERSRSGTLDGESVAEVRKALYGMQQEASEGHRLLSTAYLRDGDLQPMAALNAFSTAHRKGWTELRHRLPAQLSDVSAKVTSVFDAIAQDVAPLQGMLSGPGGFGAGQGGASGSETPSGSAGEPSAGPSGSASAGAASPSSSNGTGGLLGGDGGVGDGTSPSPSASSETAKPSITLPPLLPGLLPGLGISVEDAE